MHLRTINLSILNTTSLVATPLATISCQHKQIPLSEAVTIKDFGYVADLTENEILQKLLILNPDLEITDGELMVTVRYHRANFGIHPGFWKKSKYRGDLEVKFDSYITPLFENSTIFLTEENRKFSAQFNITEDYGNDNKLLSYHSSEVPDKFIKISEKIIEENPDSENKKLIVDFELNEGITETEKVYYNFYLEDAIFPEIIFEIN